jgi:undecaprenyl diphosphate synthase
MDNRLIQTASRLGIRPEDMPCHIAIIMDGNGRWAQKKGLPRYEGHRQGGKTAEKISQCCVDFGIEALTLYSFSIENWKRPKEEIEVLMHLYAEYLTKMRPTLMKDNVKLIHLGRINQLPDVVKDALLGTIEITSGNTGMIFAVALNYGGRAEIIDATREIASKHKAGEIALNDIDEECISRHLYTAGLPDPDLLIRTANEMRVSNFLLWQISYSEFYVTDTLWPDFEKSDLEKAILAYAKRTRRFGAVVDSKES